MSAAAAAPTFAIDSSSVCHGRCSASKMQSTIGTITCSMVFQPSPALLSDEFNRHPDADDATLGSPGVSSHGAHRPPSRFQAREPEVLVDQALQQPGRGVLTVEFAGRRSRVELLVRIAQERSEVQAAVRPCGPLAVGGACVVPTDPTHRRAADG